MLWKPPSSLVRPTRRQVLAGGAAVGAGLVGPRVARADVAPADRKFIFILACGGWDPTRVLADGFDIPIVGMEPDAVRASAGGIDYISHPNRPSVDRFFSQYASRTAVVHGMLVPSIAHEACFILSLTGSSSDAGTDWPAILGANVMERYVAPTLVLGGPTFPGINLPAVVQTGGSGQLSDLINREYAAWSGNVEQSLSTPSQQKIDAFVRRRSLAYAANARTAPAARMADAFVTAVRQSEGLKDQRHQLKFAGIGDLSEAFRIAADALELGLTRCVMVSEPVTGERGFDSHTGNDSAQQVMWDDLFTHIETLMFLLDATPGTVGETLADETTVVVFSEMGRTPWLNTAAGKDHWPYTSMMLVGSGIRGGMSIGGYDEGWNGRPIDYTSGEMSDSGSIVTCGAFGATLLTLGDVDYAEYSNGGEPLEAILT
jgi:uncharacterized protein (DUF1501 family)